MISVEKSVAFPDRGVSQVYFSLETTMLPLYSHLLGVRSGGGGKIRRRKGQLSCRQAYIAMQSLPQGRV